MTIKILEFVEALVNDDALADLTLLQLRRIIINFQESELEEEEEEEESDLEKYVI